MLFLRVLVNGGEQELTQARIKRFLDESGINKTVFCRLAGISASMLHYYLNNEREISKAMEARLNGWIDGYIARISQI